MRAPQAVLFVLGPVFLGLAACAPQVPESGPGFQDYNSYMKERASGGSYSAPAAPAADPYAAAQPAPQGFSAQGATAALDRAQGVPAASPAPSQPVYPQANPGQGAIIGDTGASGIRPRGNAPAGIQEDTREMAKVAGSAVANGNAAMSDENDFKAVSSRETIQSDKDRIARNRAQYQIVQPGALPQRTGDEGPNIVQYALATNNPVGSQMYPRSGSLRSSAAACEKFASPDLAQEWFLSNGGPQKDKRNLDPDGDGYACSWDPAPFRN